MAEQWIDAATARRLVAAVQDGTSGTEALCRRLEAGLIHSRAKLLVMGEESRSMDAEIIPRIFWLTGGNVDLEQNWETGDFRTWIGDSRWQAFGVTLGLSGVLEMLPVEQRAGTARRLSVVSNPAWLTARAARRFAYEKAGVNPKKAHLAVHDQARLGFVTGRAVLAQAFVGDKVVWEEREWDIPDRFWRIIEVTQWTSFDWERGIFSGEGAVLRGRQLWCLQGVHFLAESLQVLLPATESTPQADEAPAEVPTKDNPNPGGRPRAEWWDDMWCHVFGQIYEGTLMPEPQAAIEKAMHDWAQHHGHSPADSTIRVRAQKLFKVLSKVVENLR